MKEKGNICFNDEEKETNDGKLFILKNVIGFHLVRNISTKKAQYSICIFLVQLRYKFNIHFEVASILRQVNQI